MLCCVHLTVISLSILKVLRVPLSFRCLIFKVLRTFSESFLSVFTDLLSTVRMLLYHTLSCLSTLFSNFFKKFFKAHQVFSVLSPLSSSDECYYITPFYKLQPLFSNFLKNFFESFTYSILLQYIVFTELLYTIISLI